MPHRGMLFVLFVFLSNVRTAVHNCCPAVLAILMGACFLNIENFNVLLTNAFGQTIYVFNEEIFPIIRLPRNCFNNKFVNYPSLHFCIA